jgi:ankyrin repeat protein
MLFIYLLLFSLTTLSSEENKSLSIGKSLNIKDLSLHDYCRLGLDKELKRKIKQYSKADIDSLDKAYDQTALMACCQSSNPRSFACANILLKSGKCDINKQDQQGFTALLYLLQNRNGSKLLHTFKKKEVNPILETKEGFSALHYAASNSNPEILLNFLKFFSYEVKAANLVNKLPNHTDHTGHTDHVSHGGTALYYATQKHNHAGIKKLIDFNADPNLASTSSGYTPLMVANDSKSIKELILASASLTQKSLDGHSGLKQVATVNPLLLPLVAFNKNNIAYSKIFLTIGSAIVLANFQKSYSK